MMLIRLLNGPNPATVSRGAIFDLRPAANVFPRNIDADENQFSSRA